MRIADDHHHHQQHINRLSVVVPALAFLLTHDHQCAQSPNRRLSPPSSFFLFFSSSFSFSFPCRLFICTRPPLLRRACQEGGQLTGKSECLLECSVCGAIPASSSPSPSTVIASQPQLHSSALFKIDRGGGVGSGGGDDDIEDDDVGGGSDDSGDTFTNKLICSCCCCCLPL